MAIQAQPTVWTNQPLLLFHGTVERHIESIRIGIDLQKGRPNTDFGRGFYTTTWLEEAMEWAEKLAGRSPREAVVIEFEIARMTLASLSALWFVRGAANAADYWTFVHHNRTSNRPHIGDAWYDLVIGPVAANWQQRRCKPGADQVSFHTREAVALLNTSFKRVVR